MKISTKFRKELTISNILELIDEYDIFRRYIPQFKSTSKPFLSSLYNDKTPSVRIFYVKDVNKWFYKDFAHEDHSFDAVGYIMKKENITFNKALIMINDDFKLGLGKINWGGAGICASDVLPCSSLITPKIKLDIIKNNSKINTELKIVSCKYTIRHYNYWFKYGISKKILDLYRVKAIIGYFINGKYYRIPKDKIAFAYSFGNYKYKIMMPENNDFKWITNCDDSIIQGDSQLCSTGSLLYITKSLKDVMTLNSLGYNAVASQSENIFINIDSLNSYKKRFNKVVILFDNDNAGEYFARRFSNKYKLEYVSFSNKLKKDVSDNFTEIKNKSKMREIIDSLELKTYDYVSG